MKEILEMFGVSICGLITAVLSAAAVVVFEQWTGWDIFSFSLWVIVPVGAVGVGAAAVSGYYLGSLFFHKRANLMLLVEMAAVCALTQFLIYQFEYRFTTLKDGSSVSDLVTFSQFLEFVLTKTHYSIGRPGMQHDTGEAGSLGYWLAVIQFVGLLVGALSIFAALSERALCDKCNKYVRSAYKRTKSFGSVEELVPYFDGLYQNQVGSEQFNQMIMTDYKAKAVRGSISLVTVLQECSTCKAQWIKDSGQIYNGKEWKAVKELTRRVAMPAGTDLLPIFKQKLPV